MGYMPFQSTSIDPNKSIGQIKEFLYGVGFQKIAEISDGNGKNIIIAEIGDGEQRATFQFEVHLGIILENLPGYDSEKKTKQAGRIAWRIAHAQVKALHDSIKWGIQSIPEAFGGNFLLPDESGNAVKVANLIVEASKNNKLSAQIFTGKLLASPPEAE